MSTAAAPTRPWCLTLIGVLLRGSSVARVELGFGSERSQAFFESRATR